MSRKLLFLTLPLFFILLSWSDNDVDNKRTADEIRISKHLVKLVNDYRHTIGKPLLIRNATADALAAKHADYMISKKEVNNDNFEVRWETLEFKEHAEEISENVGVDISAEKAMNAYLGSVWLKANVEGDYTHTGIAVKKDSDGSYYYTQIFYK
tara:strand:+ start:250740 stop:251201 length:462 start_codon:yes stop_codon:yes gene_type:complete